LVAIQEGCGGEAGDEVGVCSVFWLET